MVTRRHHPLVGQRFEVVLGGPAKVVVRLHNGTTMNLPRSWTDADGAPREEPAVSTFSVEALRELIQLIDCICRRTSTP
jgi:hypothetical protein